MFRRSRSAGDEPKANQLSGAAEPNVLKVTKPGKSGDKDATEWAWTADGMTPLDADADSDEFDEGDDEGEEDKQAPIQSAEELQAELQRQAEEFGLTGDNPVGLYGPNGEEVAALLDSLAEIDDETAEEIADAYESIPEAERRVAQSVVRRRHRNGKYAYELDLAERGVTDWISSLGLEGNEGEMYGVVAAAATDAVYALILEDELADADFDTLYGAWSEVMDVEDDDDSAEGEEAATETADAAEEDAVADKQDGPFGPNTELVTEFLEKLAGLEASLIATLVSTWRNQPKEELKQAHRVLQEIADEEKLWREQLRAAQEEVFAWMDLRTTSYMEHFASSKDDALTRESAGPVVADAVAALVMADVLPEEDATILYAPWAEAIGAPEMPAYEDADDEE
jgi:hypothetical protein